MLRTPFHQYHLDNHARMVDFAGWEMPITYGSIIGEHNQVRTSGGIFDVSHMGRVSFKGPDARRFLERMCTRRVHDMTDGQCRYSLVCNEAGGVKDDVLIYRYGPEDWMLVVNASNRAKLVDHFRSYSNGLNFVMDDMTERTAMIALQGPAIIPLVGAVSSEIPALRNYRFCVKSLMLFKVTVSRTGYTGEDGVEVILPASMASTAVKLLMGQAEAAARVRPAGLGARDTLRTEAGMPLYGHEMDENTDPISAGLMFGLNLDKDQGEFGEEFIGMAALKRIHAQGPKQKLVGLNVEGKRTARQGMAIHNAGSVVGRVTSGCLSPTLGRVIAMGYVPAPLASVGSSFQIELSPGAFASATVTALPFYRRPKQA